MYNIELEEAIDIIEGSANEIKDVEIIDLRDSLGRILAEDFYAPMANPPFDRSPLDGFAIRATDTNNASKDNPVEFSVIDTVYAGFVSRKKLNEFEAIRIMTGGKMPEGSDSVIQIEDIEEKQNKIIIDKSLKPFQNYCFKGEDIKSGELLIERYTKLNAIHLGVFGSMGQRNVKVLRKPKIGILVTGDEIVSYESPLLEGKIYDTNGILISSRLKELGFSSIMINSEKDDLDSVSDSILSHINELDVLITTGGVSVGDKDIMGDVVENIGAQKLFWRLKFKPGSPMMYSKYKDKYIISLSGNPFAALATFELLGRHLLGILSNDKSINTKRTTGKIRCEFNKISKNRRFVRAIYSDGMVDFPDEDSHSSGMLLSMKDCNALIDIEKGNMGLKVEDEVEVVLL